MRRCGLLCSTAWLAWTFCSLVLAQPPRPPAAAEVDQPFQRWLPLPEGNESSVAEQMRALAEFRNLMGNQREESSAPELTEDQLNALDRIMSAWTNESGELEVPNLDFLPPGLLDKAMQDEKHIQQAKELLEQYAKKRQLPPIASSGGAQSKAPSLFPPSNSAPKSSPIPPQRTNPSRSPAKGNNSTKPNGAPSEPTQLDPSQQQANDQNSTSENRSPASATSKDKRDPQSSEPQEPPNPFQSTPTPSTQSPSQSPSAQSAQSDRDAKKLESLKQLFNQLKDWERQSSSSRTDGTGKGSSSNNSAPNNTSKNRYNESTNRNARPQNAQRSTSPGLQPNMRNSFPQNRFPNNPLQNGPSGNAIPESLPGIPERSDLETQLNEQSSINKADLDSPPNENDLNGNFPSSPSQSASRSGRARSNATPQDFDPFSAPTQSPPRPKIGGGKSPRPSSGDNRQNDQSGQASTSINREDEGNSAEGPVTQSKLRQDLQRDIENMGLGRALRRLVDATLQNDKSRTSDERSTVDGTSTVARSPQGIPFEDRSSGASNGSRPSSFDPMHSEGTSTGGRASGKGGRPSDQSTKRPNNSPTNPNEANNQPESKWATEVRSTVRKFWDAISAPVPTSPDSSSTASSSSTTQGSSNSASNGTEWTFRWGTTQTLLLAGIVGLLGFALWLNWRRTAPELEASKTEIAWVQAALATGVRSRADIVRMFHQLVASRAQLVPRWWTHRAFEKKFTESSPQLRVAMSELSDAYEFARYTRPDMELSPEQLQRVQTALEQCVARK